MTGPESRKAVERVTPSPMGERIIFWSLAFLSFATFVPCVILPEWRAYEALEVAKQREQHRLEVVLEAIEKEERLLKAMRSDTVIIDRVVQRDLKYQRAGERVVRVALPDRRMDVAAAGAATRLADGTFEPKPVLPPATVARALAILPGLDYDRIFCDEKSRPVIMCMSVALLLVAFGLYGRRSSRNIA